MQGLGVLAEDRLLLTGSSPAVETRFPWRPDYQDEIAVHAPEPDVPDDPCEAPTCVVCGRTLDIIFVHSFEIPVDESLVVDMSGHAR